MRPRRLVRQLTLASIVVVTASCAGPAPVNSPRPSPTAALTTIHKIKHVIVIMQENRTYVHEFVLQVHMCEHNASWSLPEHLFQVSEWSAHCTQHNNSASCTNALQDPGNPPDFGPPPHTTPIYAWTDLTYLLHKHSVS